MSVVNDMLRDLEKRKAPERDAFSGTQSSSESLIEPQRRGGISMNVVLLLFCVIAAALAGYLVFTPSNEALKQNDIVQAPQGQQRADTAPEVVAESVVQTEKNMDIESVPAKSIKQPVGKGSKAKPEAKKEQIAEVQVAKEKKAATPTKSAAISKAQTTSKTISTTTSKTETIPKASTPTKNSTVASQRESSSINTKPTEAKKNAGIGSVVSDSVVSKNVVSENVVSKDDLKIATQDMPQNFQVSLSPEAQDEQVAGKAETLFRQGQSLQAYELLEGFVAKKEITTFSEALLAQAYLQDGQEDKFLSLLDNAKKPLDYRLRQSKARWMLGNNDVKGAIEVLKSDAPMLSESPDHFALLASALQRDGQYRQVFEIYSELIQFNDQIADWWAGLGLSADQMGQSRQARVAYQQALSMRGLNPTLARYIRQRMGE